MNIGQFTFSEFKEMARAFHGYPAPGLLIGGYMVEAAKARLPEGTLFEAMVETPKCLPDAVQLLTLCSTGNGWMRVVNLGRYALSLYDKRTGEGWRVFLDLGKLSRYPEIAAWFMKTKKKAEQDTERLFSEIEAAGATICGIVPVTIAPGYLKRKHQQAVGACPICGEAYPVADGAICRGCQGDAPYRHEARESGNDRLLPEMHRVPVAEAIGKTALHDMTRIIPGESKGPAVSAGQEISAGDLCRLQQMGRSHVYVVEDNPETGEWVHENIAAEVFARRMAGENVIFKTPPKEGKIDLRASRTGLLRIDMEKLRQFNMVSDVTCASRQNLLVVEEDKPFAGCRAIPLYLSRINFSRALAALGDTPLFDVIPIKPAEVGILVTGTEVFQGLIEDRFEPVIRAKVEHFGCRVVRSRVVPDDRLEIEKSVREMIGDGVELLVTTAGLSVDPDDVTRPGLIDAGLTDILYGAPILPGAMTLVGRIGATRVIGVPACALYHRVTSLDLLLPRILAGIDITRPMLADFAHGGFCLNCRSCTFPKCPFGK